MQSHASRFKRPTLLIVGCGDVGMPVLRLLRGRHRLLALTPHAERAALLRWYGAAMGARVTILRIPGIYAVDRVGGQPRERVARGTPVLAAEDDVYTNHVHADDLARACVAALVRGLPQRVVHASDDTDLKMGDYFDLAADLAGLPRPARIARADAERLLPATLLSFMSESRRLVNDRLKKELRVVLRHPTVASGL